MNRRDSDRWQSEILDEIFAALAAGKELAECLVFKGARVLSAILHGGRQSLDLDSNLLRQFAEKFPDRELQRSFLEQHIRRAVVNRFESQDPVKFELRGIAVKPKSREPHPMGWDGFEVKLNIHDLTRPGVKSLPSIEIDVAAPEELLATSLSELRVGESSALAYSLTRIAGEKMRAFLSSLPAYRIKLKKPGETVRAKDLYDLARIHRAHDFDDTKFWKTAAQEFRLACRSRFIDCSGLDTFMEQWQVTSQTYAQDPTIPKDINVDEARRTLEAVVTFMLDDGVIPFDHPLPPTAHT
jgi:hypothetical protein